jgi:hypothetical protein
MIVEGSGQGRKCRFSVWEEEEKRTGEEESDGLDRTQPWLSYLHGPFWVEDDGKLFSDVRRLVKDYANWGGGSRIDWLFKAAVACGMRTHVIIDGYNLLATGGMPSGHLESARETLLRDLATYRHRKNHLVTVVFDGWQQGLPVEQREHRAGVQVIYSKRGERADQVIQRLAREYGADCAVVSSDHEIVNAARAHGAFVMGAREFAEKLRMSSGAAGTIPYKELDSGDDSRPRRGTEKKGNPRKLPKSQRQRDRQLRRF